MNNEEMNELVDETINLSSMRSKYWNRIPVSLMNEKCWLIGTNEKDITKAGKRPCTIDHLGNLVPASIKLKHDWLSYEEAVIYADSNDLNVGIVLHPDLNIAVIDLDIKDKTSPEVKSEIHNLIKTFDSYTELSSSGKGFHIYLKTEMQISGVHPRNFPIPIEIYTKDRFMLCTGNEVFIDDSMNVIELSDTSPVSMRKLLHYREPQLEKLLSLIGVDKNNCANLIEVAPDSSDDDVLSLIYSSAWGIKFVELGDLPHSVDFSQYGYPSCSEVDIYLIGIICRHTESNSQVRRLFRTLTVANRDKHIRGDYHINLCISKARYSIECNREEMELATKATAEFFDSVNNRIDYERNELKKLTHNVEHLEFAAYESTNDFKDMIPFPSGMAGEMCQFMIDIAPHKLREAALAGTLAMLSAICGRQWNFSGAGLNNYYIVIAPSATGKETSRRGIGRMADVLSAVGGDKFFVFDTMASKQAYLTLFSKSETTSHLIFVPEFAKYSRALRQKQNTVMQAIYSFWLEIFPRSAKGDVNGGNKRASSDDSISGVLSPAMTLLGDCTPDDYYEGITEEMQRDGFCSRFVNIEYLSGKKSLSDFSASMTVVPEELAFNLKELAKYALDLKAKEEVISVNISPEIIMQVKSFEQYTVDMINRTMDERYRQPFNRCYLKIMTVASLLAITRNMFAPVISLEDFNWAKGLIMRDVYNITSKLDEGTFGTSDTNNTKLVLGEIRRCLTPVNRTEFEKNKFNDLLDKGIVPRSILQTRLASRANFKRDGVSADKLLDSVLDDFAKNGWLIKIDKNNRIEWYTKAKYTGKYTGLAYIILDSHRFQKEVKNELK